MEFLRCILYFSSFALVMACPLFQFCPCGSPADCDKFFTCFGGQCKADPFPDSRRLPDHILAKDQEQLEQLGKHCLSHSDCNDNQFCIYGQCDPISTGDSGTPRARFCSRDNDCAKNQFCRQGQCWKLRDGLVNGKRVIGKECLTNMDCEWFEVCIGEIRICYWAWPGLYSK